MKANAKTSKVYMVIGLALFLVLAMTTSSAATIVQGTAEAECNIPLTGDQWNVTGTHACADMVINMDNTLLNITSGATLIFKNVTITNSSGLIVDGTFVADNETEGNSQEYGYLTISATGTLNATSGTTTITNESSDGRALFNNGTFTHNNGLINFTLIDTEWRDLIAPREYYDIEVAVGNGNTLSVAGGVVGAMFNITNDLTVSSGQMAYSNKPLEVDGDVSLTGVLNSSVGGYDMTFGSLTINSGGTYSATSGTTTLTSEDASGAAFNNMGTFTHNNGLVNFTITADSAGITGDLSTFYNVEINIPSDKEIVIQSSNFVASNDLTISSGRFKIGNLVLADSIMVSGDVDVTGTLGRADSLATGDYSFGSLTINSGGTYAATSGISTIPGNVSISGIYDSRANGEDLLGTLGVKTGGTYYATSGNINITNKGLGASGGPGGSYSLVVGDNSAWGSNGETVYISTTGTSYMYIRNSESIYNLVSDCTGQLRYYNSHYSTVANDLTLNDGSMTFPSGKATVTGDVVINDGATLDGGSSTMTFGSLTINNGGTYDATSGTTTITSKRADNDNVFLVVADSILTHNNGLINITSSSGDMFSAPLLYDLEIASSGTILTIGGGAQVLSIENDLTISAGTFDVSTGTDDILNVTGDVDVTGTLDGGDGGPNHNFGSLTINSGGTYSATSGTTTITSETSGNLAINCDGTLTANSGIFSVETIDDTQHDLLCTGNLYDLILNTSGDFSATKVWAVDNDLTITTGNLFHSTLGVTVGGDVVINGGSLTGGSAAMTFGSLTINSGGTYDATSGTTTITSETAEGYSVNFDGTYTANSGLLLITNPSPHKLDITTTGGVYDLQLSHSTQSSLDSHPTINNDLTLVSSDLRFTTGASNMVVTGDVDIQTGSTYGDGSDTGSHSFGSLTINSGGTYEATSGTTTISGNFDNDGAFTHNGGTVLFDTVSKRIQSSGSTATTFYDLDINEQTFLDKSITVIDDLLLTTGKWLLFTVGGPTITMGNASQAGTITNTNIMDAEASGTGFKIYGANQLYPAVLTGGFFSDPDGLAFDLKWIDWQSSVITAGSATITLDGDCEFDAFTVSSGDTLDLNGQRAEFGGLLDNDGTLNANNSLIIVDGSNGIDIDGTLSATNSTAIMNAGASNIAYSDIQTGTETIKTVLINSGANYNTGPWTLELDKLIIGAPTLIGATGGHKAKNLTIATGGIYSLGSQKTTVSGDFKSSGGLIGKSALTLNPGDSQFVNIGDIPDVDFGAENFAIDVWVKRNGIDTLQFIVGKDSSGQRQFDLTMQPDNTVSITYWSGASLVFLTTTDTITDTKWHHIVGQRNGNSFDIYIDGKLSATGTTSGSHGTMDSTSSDLNIGRRNFAGNFEYFNGSIARVSIWNQSLSQAQIREIMFQQYSEVGAISENITGWWQFDEGTGTSVADSSVNGNTGTASDSGVWAGGGTFIMGTSTVNMTGDGTIWFYTGDDFYNVEVAQSGKTTAFANPFLTNQLIDIYGTFTVAGGTLTDGAFDQNIYFRGNSSPVITGSSDLTGIKYVLYREGYANITGTTYDTLYSRTNDRYLLGDTIVNTDLFVFTSGKALISSGYNITTQTATVTGTLNLTAGSSLIFEDTAGAGFGTSSGTLNMIGTTNNYVQIMSETEPNPANIPTINATTFTDIQCKYVNVSTVEALGDEYVVCFGQNISAVGFWDFISPIITLAFPSPANTTVLQYNETFLMNWTAEDTSNLAYMFYNITHNNTGVQVESNEISVHGNTTYTWLKNITANWGIGNYSLEPSAADDHNPDELKEKTATKNARKLEVWADNEKVGHKLHKKKFTDIESSVIYLKEADTSLSLEFLGKTKNQVKSTVEYMQTDSSEYFKLTHKVKLDNKAELTIIMEEDNLLYLPDSDKRGHFTYGKRGKFWYDYSDVPDPITLTITGKPGKYYVKMTSPDWKKNQWVEIDPVSSGTNIRTEYYTFEVVDTTAPWWNQTPTNQQAEFNTTPFTYQINATDNFQTDTYSVNDTTNFKMTTTDGYGTLENNTGLVFNTFYFLRLTINDTEGNSLSQDIWVYVNDTTIPTWQQLPQNQSLEYSNPFSYQVNATDPTTITYYLNDSSNFTIGSATGIITQIYPNNTGLTPLGNYTFIIIAQDAGLNNLTQPIIVDYHDETFPVWTQEPQNQTTEYYQDFSYDINATDLLLSTYYLNDTTNFKINSATGLIENNLILEFQYLYYLQVYVNDTIGNTIGTNITVMVNDTTPPAWTILPTDQYLFPNIELGMQINATDDSNISLYFLNSTFGGIFNMSASGYMANATGIVNGTYYYLTASVNDSANNIQNATFWVYLASPISNFTIEILDVDSGSLIIQVRASEGFINDAGCNLTVFQDGDEIVFDNMTDAERMGVYSSDFGNLKTDNYAFIIDCARGWKSATLLNTTSVEREIPSASAGLIYGFFTLAFFILAGISRFRKSDDDEGNVPIESICLFAGFLMALIGVRVMGEIVALQSATVAANINTSVTVLQILLFIVIVIMGLKLVMHTIKTISGVR